MTANDSYDRHFHRTDWQALYERQKQRAQDSLIWLDRLNLTPGDTLIDVGTGPGFVAIQAVPYVTRSGKIYAVDQAQGAIDQLKKQNPFPYIIEPILAPGDAIPLKDGLAQAVLMANVLHHLENPKHLIVEAKRLLAPTGRLLLVEFDPEGPTDFGPPQKERMSLDTATELLTSSGFTHTQTFLQKPIWYTLLATR